MKKNKLAPEVTNSQVSGLKLNSKSTAVSFEETSGICEDPKLLDLDISIIPQQMKYNFDTF